MDKYLNKVYFIFLLLLASCTSTAPTTPFPTIKQGVLDLSNWSFEKNKAIPLKGEWEVYWQKLLSPETLAQHKPSALFDLFPSWKGKTINQQALPHHAQATYHTRVIIAPSQLNNPLAIKFKVSEFAYKIFINGKLSGKIGQIGTTNNAPIYSTNIYTFTPQTRTIDLVLQISNHNTHVSSLIQSLDLGQPTNLYLSHQQALNVNFLLFGSLLIIALYHFSLFYFRRQATSPLYFGLLCLTIAVRILTLGEFNMTDVFPWFDFEWHEKFSYLTYYIATLVTFIFIRSVFTDEFPRLLAKLIPWVIWPFILLTIFTNSRVFSKVLPVFQLFTVVSVFIGFYILGRAVLNKSYGAKAFLLGYIAISGTAVHDIIYALGIIHTGHLFPWGLFIFILSQAVALSGRFSRAFVQSEQLSQELNDLNQDLEHQVQSRTRSLEKTREELQLKNDNITASITYAQRIQDAILPGWNNVQKHLPESFLMFRPKDLVSGDFYWFAALEKSEQVNEKLILAAVDCTGHGVPGAFMSLIGNNLLNQIILERKIFSPDLILSALNKEVKQVLKQHETHNRDGMDLALVVIDQEAKTMEFAGAQNPLYLLQNGELTVLKGDKAPIGGKQYEQEIAYQKHCIDITQPTTFYLASDGFQDQFGGPSGRKFMVKAFRRLLFDIHPHPMSTQHEILTQTLTDWKKDEEEQVDDILVIGIKLS
ncbi:hypothetical protein BKI52_27800 [marine bacterium AO1-C]|nr:hypothetical protein BKI52_27800 [marine bacterium AO1-C]